MRKLILASAAAVALLSAPAYAGVASQTFSVNVTLTSLCRVKTNTLGLTFTYTAFGAAQSGVAGGAATFECTRGFTNPPTVAFDTANGGSSAAGQGATGDGEVKGIAYTLAVTAGAPTAGTDATATTVGTATEYVYTLTGGLLATQAGGGGTAGPVTRTLMLAY